MFELKKIFLKSLRKMQLLINEHFMQKINLQVVASLILRWILPINKTRTSLSQSLKGWTNGNETKNSDFFNSSMNFRYKIIKK